MHNPCTLKIFANSKRKTHPMSNVPDDVEAERLRLELRLRLLETQDSARKKFFDFVRYIWPDAILGAHHRKMSDAFDRIANGTLKRLIVNMPPRHPLTLDTPVPTTEGWKTIETIQAGDYVFSPDGTPVRVIGKSPVSHKEIYEVTTSDGQTVCCDGSHLWTVRFGSQDFVTLSTEAILHRLETEGWRRFNNYPMLPPYQAAQFPYKELPVDPYVLGVWLGDGSSSAGTVGCSFADMPVMRGQVEECGYTTTHNPKFQQFNILGLLPKLREIGVLNNKHIPQAYLCSSVQQRTALLQGLIDTDGDVTKEGKVTFNNSNLRLIEDVLCLVHSLGIKARITQRQTSYKGKPSQPSYRLMFKASNVARLPRKAIRCRALQGNWGRSIDIRKTNRTADVQCIQVENEDGLFMAGRGWVVTHNSKSEFASYLLPAYLMGRDPRLQIIEATHTAELATRFGRKVRDLMDSDTYKELFSEVQLKADSKAAGRWDTNRGGAYFAVGVGGAVTGRGADLLIIDDPHSEQDAMSDLALDNAWEWYQGGPRTRLQPGGAIVLVMTRWGTKDLTARLLKAQTSHHADRWEVIEFPAILPSGKPLWPEFWKIEELEAVRASLSVQKWNAMYQQQPTNDEGAILKREWWRKWERDDPPAVDYIIQSYDTAYSKKETADFSVITTWGVFFPSMDDGANIILLGVKRGRWDFPELKRVALDEYKYWNPDNVLIEAKATGVTLQQEMRRLGIPVTMYSPGGRRTGTDKVSRANAVAPILESGLVWAPQTGWAEELVEECAAFPNGDHDDMVDSTTMALMRFRQGNFISLNTDEPETESSADVVPEYY